MDTKSEIARLERERERATERFIRVTEWLTEEAERLTGEREKREELVKEARAVRARFQGL